MTKDLLIELACEELPPKALKSLAQSFAISITDGLAQARFNFEGHQWFATPRRLAVLVKDLEAKQQDIDVIKKGPPVSSAYDSEGNPTKAALGWAKSNGIALSEAQIIETPKGKWLQAKLHETGKNINSCLQDIIKAAVNKLPVPKVMRWGNSEHQFVRPVHNLCCLYGSDEIAVEVLGKTGNNQILGHRFHSPGFHKLDNASNYQQLTNKLNVIADFELRKTLIRDGLSDIANKLDAKVIDDDDLLEEVTSLVELPVILQAEFDERFLNVPKEPLIYTMKDDQRYFPLLSNNTNILLNQFLFVSNIQSSNPDSVVSGNEKVVRPRLADAQFFYDYDMTVSTDSRLKSLKTIVYQKQLGTLYEKSSRVAKLSEALSKLLELGDPQLCSRAGLLAKSDLTSKVVYEFPDVQGYMGQYYAEHNGEAPEVAEAIAEHYMPRSATDSLPKNEVSQIVSMAERLDTLVGIFGIGLLPKGDKDPFALRRATLGIIKVVLENDIRFNLEDSLRLAASMFDNNTLSNSEWQAQLTQFFNARLENYFVDQGLSVNTVRSVIKVSGNAINTIKYRLEALTNFNISDSETLSILTESNKRIANILSKSEFPTTDVIPGLFTEPQESALWDALQAIGSTTRTVSRDAEYYQDTLRDLAMLKDPITEFFNGVMVNAKDEKIKANRFALLSKVRKSFLSVADFSLLQV